MLSLAILEYHTIVIHYSRVSRDSIIAASAVEKSRSHIAILSQMQLIVQPYYKLEEYNLRNIYNK